MSVFEQKEHISAGICWKCAVKLNRNSHKQTPQLHLLITSLSQWDFYLVIFFDDDDDNLWPSMNTSDFGVSNLPVDYRLLYYQIIQKC